MHEALAGLGGYGASARWGTVIETAPGTSFGTIVDGLAQHTASIIIVGAVLDVAVSSLTWALEHPVGKVEPVWVIEAAGNRPFLLPLHDPLTGMKIGIHGLQRGLDYRVLVLQVLVMEVQILMIDDLGGGLNEVAVFESGI